MKTFLFTFLAIAIFSATGCEVQSEMAKKSVEKLQPSPTPAIVKQTAEAIDPADVVNADASEQGPTLFANEDGGKKAINCKEYNRVMVNGSRNEITITGVCSQIMVNGHGNQISALAAVEIITYGRDNQVSYSKFVNGNRPVVKDTAGSNAIAKLDGEGAKAPKK
ncbi:MAG: DUF3060 domain-containing protein [bacterium]|nr:DUF3060 domain-containing protein [bacterium]